MEHDEESYCPAYYGAHNAQDASGDCHLHPAIYQLPRSFCLYIAEHIQAWHDLQHLHTVSGVRTYAAGTRAYCVHPVNESSIWEMAAPFIEYNGHTDEACTSSKMREQQRQVVSAEQADVISSIDTLTATRESVVPNSKILK